MSFEFTSVQRAFLALMKDWINRHRQSCFCFTGRVIHLGFCCASDLQAVVGGSRNPAVTAGVCVYPCFYYQCMWEGCWGEQLHAASSSKEAHSQAGLLFVSIFMGANDRLHPESGTVRTFCLVHTSLRDVWHVVRGSFKGNAWPFPRGRSSIAQVNKPTHIQNLKHGTTKWGCPLESFPSSLDVGSDRKHSFVHVQDV